MSFPFRCLLSLSLLLHIGYPAISQKPVLYSGEQEVKIGYEAIGYLPVADSVVTYAQARKHFDRNHFLVNTLPDLNLGIAQDNYWIGFSILNTTSQPHEVYIKLGNPRLNEVDVYTAQGDSLSTVLRLGDNFPFYTRVVNYTQFVFPVRLLPEKKTEVLLLVRHKGNTLQMPVVLFQEHALLAHVESDYLFIGVVSGIYLITFFFGLFLLFYTRDALFVSYCGYILSVCTWAWTTEGFAFQFLWPDSPDLATRVGPGVSAISACFFLANCLQFCKPYDTTSRYRKILTGFLIALVLWSLTPFIPGIPITEKTMAVFLSVYFSFNVVVALLVVVYMSWLSAKHRIVLYFLFAILITISFSVLSVLKGSGVINLPFTTGILMSTAYIVELILMTAGITHQFYNYRKEKEETLIAYAEQQRSINEKILATQKEERNRISRELHDDIGPRLTQITFMSEAARRQLPEESNPGRELGHIADTTRQLVTSMGEIIWSLNPGNMSLHELFSYLRDQLHLLLEHSGIRYDIHIDAPKDHALRHSVLRNTLLVTKEVTHNAVKHSQAKEIHISCVTGENAMHFVIRDTGIGIRTEHAKGNGLRNIRHRIEELGGTLSIDSAPDRGTTVRYTIPLN